MGRWALPSERFARTADFPNSDARYVTVPVFSGIDWAEDRYDLAIVADGEVVRARPRIDHDTLGYQLLLGLLAALSSNGRLVASGGGEKVGAGPSRSGAEKPPRERLSRYGAFSALSDGAGPSASWTW